jgi:hypothetical protein
MLHGTARVGLWTLRSVVEITLSPVSVSLQFDNSNLSPSSALSTHIEEVWGARGLILLLGRADNPAAGALEPIPSVSRLTPPKARLASLSDSSGTLCGFQP